MFVVLFIFKYVLLLYWIRIVFEDFISLLFLLEVLLFLYLKFFSLLKGVFIERCILDCGWFLLGKIIDKLIIVFFFGFIMFFICMIYLFFCFWFVILSW